MEATLSGYPWLPRMIDKARASMAGMLGPYYRYPCPIDRACLARLAVDHATFAAAAAAPTDEAVLDRLERSGANLQGLTEFDPVALNDSLHKEGS